jgi:hypothetical protein
VRPADTEEMLTPSKASTTFGTKRVRLSPWPNCPYRFDPYLRAWQMLLYTSWDAASIEERAIMTCWTTSGGYRMCWRGLVGRIQIVLDDCPEDTECVG